MAQQERVDWWAGAAAPQPRVVAPRRSVEAEPEPLEDRVGGAVYRSVQDSEAFQEIRRGYRAFVFPACAGFLAWYLLFVSAEAFMPDLLGRRIAGPLNVAWTLGLGQFASTFLLTWLYARNARTKRDRAALELRWDTQDQLR
ncbi:DUF485 domain-containing protein [Kitasatospora sp. CB01950]|uniref:DUF485 domain-containing protein n=1 Tax=Kitasatospora sp. CB01950 TaxID=1703930 RepID=UPI00093CC1D8|nr:DUF485 domain-containing protein [Kitasatospora sp. CB01950]